MKNPTPGKNPFELESYRDKMPLHVRELYDDMTRNYAKLQGRAGLGRFWRFWAFAVCYIALLMVISDTTTDTILVFVGLVLCGWLYIAVPSFTISVRRLHDDGKPVFWGRSASGSHFLSARRVYARSASQLDCLGNSRRDHGRIFRIYELARHSAG